MSEFQQESETSPAGANRAQGRVIGPLASMAFSFAVLLDGVTSGDVTHASDQNMYSVAAIMLGIGGVSHFLEDGARTRPKVEVEGFGRIGLAEWLASAITRGLVSLATQLLAIYLTYLLCKRGSDALAGAFILSVFGALAFYGLVATALRWFFALRNVNAWMRKRERQRYKFTAHAFTDDVG